MKVDDDLREWEIVAWILLTPAWLILLLTGFMFGALWRVIRFVCLRYLSALPAIVWCGFVDGYGDDESCV